MKRLKTRRQFQAVLAGSKVAATAHFVLHRCSLGCDVLTSSQPLADSKPKLQLFSSPDVWLGAMVPKRWAKRAVTRNSIKRQIYDVSSQFDSVLPAAAHVVRLRTGFDRSKFVSANSTALTTAVRSELHLLFSNAGLVAKRINSSDTSR